MRGWTLLCMLLVAIVAICACAAPLAANSLDVAEIQVMALPDAVVLPPTSSTLLQTKREPLLALEAAAVSVVLKYPQGGTAVLRRRDVLDSGDDVALLKWVVKPFRVRARRARRTRSRGSCSGGTCSI